jgi:hypothetical protein
MGIASLEPLGSEQCVCEIDEKPHGHQTSEPVVEAHRKPPFEARRSQKQREIGHSAPQWWRQILATVGIYFPDGTPLYIIGIP